MLEDSRMLFIIIFGSFLALCQAAAMDDGRRCNFDKSKRDYNSTDLLLCMYELASNAFGQENSESIDEKTHAAYQGRQHHQFPSSELTGKGITDFIGSIINGGLSLPYQMPSFLSDAIGSYYQPNYPVSPNLPLRPLNALNLYDALYSISMYDDLKCVPRILCEVASGSMAGGSVYKQSSNFLPEFGKNALFGLLSAFDTTGASPLLNFGKAALLGYTNRENSGSCYREYPKCPRNPEQLIHYLNNHNGGFFRFFNKYRHGLQSSQQHQPYPQQSSGYYGRSEEEAAAAAALEFPSRVSDRTGTGEIKFDLPLLSARRDQRNFFPREAAELGQKKLVFPGQQGERANRESRPSRASSKSSVDSPVPSFSTTNVPFFPQVIRIQRSGVQFPEDDRA